MTITKLIKRALIAASFVAVTPVANAEIAIVVNPDSGMASATASEISQLFLGKRNEIDGQPARAIDQEEGSEARDEFYTKVVEKTGSQLNAYWSRLIFTGKGMPPDKVMDDADVIDMVSEETDLVGYVRPSSVTENVKVILVIP
ncbi:MAG: phosphate ABC transporter substrate-binding protein [Ketobacteraceae bacterium]|nr:phosphate ABC transporter substrate-binding protein [Ketobacteraceae bacterium]